MLNVILVPVAGVVAVLYVRREWRLGGVLAGRRLERREAYQARLRERLERFPEDAGYALLRGRAARALRAEQLERAVAYAPAELGPPTVSDDEEVS